MTLTVLGRELIKVFNAIGASKQVINITVDKTSLVLQAYEPIIINDVLPIASVVKLDKCKEIAVELDASYNIIRDDEFVEVDITEQSLALRTNSFHGIYNRVFIQPISFNSIEGSETYSNISVDSFEQIARIEAPILAVSKSLKVNEPAVVVSKGYAYLTLSNMACRVKVDLPDCVLSLKVVKAVTVVLKENSISTVNLEIEKTNGNYCIIQIGAGRLIAFTFKYDNSLMPNMIDGLIDQCTDYVKLSFSNVIEGVRIMATTFKQIEARMSVGKTGVLVTVQHGVTNQLRVGDISVLKDSVLLRTNIVVLNSLMRIFGSSAIDIKKGGRYLCCQTSKVTVLMSGVN